MVGLSITGQGLTEQARNLVVSGRWRDAFLLLTEGIEGLSSEEVLAVLKGEMRLSGKDRMVLEAEDSDAREAYAEEVTSVYVAGRMVHDGKRYKAYAKVSTLPELTEAEKARDRVTGAARFPRIRNTKETDCREDLLHLCHNREEDLILPVNGRQGRGGCVYLLLENDGDSVDLPLWLAGAIPSDAQSVYDLSEGCFQEYGSEPVLSPFQAPSKRETFFQEPCAAAPGSGVEPQSDEDWHVSLRKLNALAAAKEQGYESVEAYSSVLRAEVRHSIRSSGDVWDNFAFRDTSGATHQIRYPRNLALKYALMRTAASSLAPAWAAVCAEGLKMVNDNPVHTDLWLAMGYNLDGTEYDHENRANRVISALSAHLQKEALRYELHVLTSAGKDFVEGTFVRHDDPNVLSTLKGGPVLLWVPYAGEEFAVLAAKSAAVICEAGGRLAHLVLVGREQGIPVVRVAPDSLPNLSGTPAVLNLNEGRLEFSTRAVGPDW
jgi:phosphohistidine swiveling domain-containing protein